MKPLLDAFISYGRADSKDFAIRLRNYLIGHGLKIWLDLDDIPKGVDYQTQIESDLERAHNVLFIMSPHAVNSIHCRAELDMAVRFNKRIIPLLHVPEIDQATWHQHYPDKTEADWMRYQAEKRQFGDQRNPFLHPGIYRINWINFEESTHGFDAACGQLLDIFRRCRDYVEKHTHLLTRALEWERNQQRSRFLLVGQDLYVAREWLLTRFNEQPPCRPTDLHCEFIAESVKNSDNLMTQVFLAYAETDRAIADKLRYSLMRMGITVWSSNRDIDSGQDFHQAVNQGIEATDNVVFLVSPESLKGPNCQHELDYALSLNKRVIPLLSKAVEAADMSPSLQILQHIDLTDNVGESDYDQDTSQLLRVLHQDADYYREHKTLLVKALQWERQQRNPGILLRGYNLRAAETWLKTARPRDHHPPTPVQIAFIEESLEKPPEASLDVFFSYSLSDSEFARKLNNALQTQGKKTWFDQESIAAGTADFEQEIYAGIERSDNFLFVLSPQAVASPYCDREVEHAARLNKRFITVLHRQVNPKALPPALAKVQWVNFSQISDQFYTGFNQVIRILETDRDHVQRHTQISLQALQWLEKNQSPDLLLRGGELEADQAWFTEAKRSQKHPPPTDLQKTYMQASEAAHQAAIREDQRRRRLLQSLLGLMTVAFVGALGVSIYAVSQKQLADKFLRGQIGLLSDQTHSLVQNGHDFDALLQATHAGHLLHNSGNMELETVTRVVNALQESLIWVKARNRVKAHTHEIQAMSLSPDGQLIATASQDKTVKIWGQDGRLIQTLPHGNIVEGVRFTPDGQHIVTHSRDSTVRLWTRQGELKLESPYEADIWSLDISPDSQWAAVGGKRGQVQILRLEDGRSVQTFSYNRPVEGIRFSPDGAYLASWDSQGNTFKLWNRDGTLQHTLEHPLVWEVIFSPNGQTIATRSKDGVVKVWSITGEERYTLDLESTVFEFIFSPDSQQLATATSSGEVQLWRVETGQALKAFKKNSGGFTDSAHGGKINSIYFGPNGQTLVTASSDYTVKVWSLTGQELHRFQHQSEVWEAIPSPDGRWIVSYDNQSLLRIWDLERQPAVPLKGHTLVVTRSYFSPDGQSLGTTSQDGQLILWSREGHQLKTLTNEGIPLRDFKFSGDRQLIATGGGNGLAKLYQLDGNLLQALRHDSSVVKIQISPDAQLIATYQDNSMVKLWSVEGQLLRTLEEQYSPMFSSDGQLLITVQAGNVHLWRVEDKAPYLNEKCLLKGPPELKVIRQVTLSPNGRTLFTANTDGTARVWSLGCEQRLVLKHGGNDVKVLAVASSQDGQIIVTVGSDNTAKLWSLNGDLRKTLKGHKATVFKVMFNPNGQSFATAANDQTVKIWSLQGDLLRTLQHPNEIQRIQYSADGRQLVVAHGQTPTLWNLDSEVLKPLSELQSARKERHRRSAPLTRWSPQEEKKGIAEHPVYPLIRLESLMLQACEWLNPYLEQLEEDNQDQALCKIE